MAIKKIRRRCQCGCGGITSSGRKYIFGHGSRGYKFSEESKLKMSLAHKGIPLSEKCKKNMSLVRKGYKYSEKAKLNMSLGQLKRYNSTKLEYCGVWYDMEYRNSIRKDYCENINCKNGYKRLGNHHVYLDKKRCAPDELITLCNPCHAILHRKLAQQNKYASANPKDFIIINRPNHVSYIYKGLRKIVRINKRI